MIVFAQTRYHYPSYTDFFRLVAAAGFPVCFVDEINARDDRKTYIFSPMNGEGMERLKLWSHRRAKIIWWNLERPEDETLPRSLDLVKDSVDAVWVSDRIYAALNSRLTYVPVAGHPDFGTRSTEKIIDVCHLAYLWGRRASTIDALRARGITVAGEAWGRHQQDAVVAKSHLMLNMHQYDEMKIIAPIRFAVAASYAIPIVSEPFADPKAASLAIQARLGELPNLISVLLKDPSGLREAGWVTYEQMCLATDFRREVEKGVQQL